MTSDRAIPVLIGGPSAGTPIPPDAGPVVLGLVSDRLDELGPDDDIRAATVEYVRRSYGVAGVFVHAWVYRPLADNEAAEAMWSWLLEKAGCPDV